MMIVCVQHTQSNLKIMNTPLSVGELQYACLHVSEPCQNKEQPWEKKIYLPRIVARWQRNDVAHTHSPGRQEVGPDIDSLIGHLEAAEDAVQGGASRVAVPRDDAILPEHLRAMH